MTVSAATHLGEEQGRRLAEALSDDDRFGTVPLDLNEIAPRVWQLVLYFEHLSEPTKDALADIASAVVGKRAEFVYEKLPDTDWVAKSLEGLKPVRAGRFLVHGRHDRDRLRPNDIGIEIEAGQAFGTGHHGTTAACLAEIDRIVRARPIRNALDIGTGSGVLAVAIAKAAKARVLASDIDPLAARIAEENARLNGVAGLVRIVPADGLAKRVFRERASYDLIVANILAGPLVALAPAIRRLTARGGAVILSGLLPHQRTRIAAVYRDQGLRLVRARTLNGWLTLVFQPGK
jgi:ribosomal protein L11 methyltransferase